GVAGIAAGRFGRTQQETGKAKSGVRNEVGGLVWRESDCRCAVIDVDLRVHDAAAEFHRVRASDLLAVRGPGVLEERSNDGTLLAQASEAGNVEGWNRFIAVKRRKCGERTGFLGEAGYQGNEALVIHAAHPEASGEDETWREGVGIADDDVRQAGEG